MTWSEPDTWFAGEKWTAAFMNTRVRDNFKAIGDPWTAYVPVLGSNGSAPTTSLADGSYRHYGRHVEFWARLIISTPGTGIYSVTYPVTPARVYTPGVSGHYLDLNLIDVYPINSVNNTTAALRMTCGSAVAPPTESGFVGHLFPVTAAAGDEIVIGGVYEAAANP